MWKFFVVVFLVAAIVWAIPQSRERVQDQIQVLLDKRSRSSVKRTLERMVVDLQRTVDETGLFPQPDAFEDWLLQTYRSAEDPWGSTYYYRIWADSFMVGSAGPDTVLRTDDDIRVTERRERGRRR